jgi:hypothetical protein
MSKPGSIGVSAEVLARSGWTERVNDYDTTRVEV